MPGDFDSIGGTKLLFKQPRIYIFWFSYTNDTRWCLKCVKCKLLNFRLDWNQVGCRVYFLTICRFISISRISQSVLVIPPIQNKHTRFSHISHPEYAHLHLVTQFIKGKPISSVYFTIFLYGPTGPLLLIWMGHWLLLLGHSYQQIELKKPTLGHWPTERQNNGPFIIWMC